MITVGQLLKSAIAAVGIQENEAEYEKAFRLSLEIFKLWVYAEKNLYVTYCDCTDTPEASFGNITIESTFAYGEEFIAVASYYISSMLAPEKEFFYTLYCDKVNEIRRLCSSESSSITDVYA